MKLDQTDIARYMRACEYWARSCGYEGALDDIAVTFHEYAPRDKWSVWAASALWRAFKDLSDPREGALLAFRGLLLAKEYRGSNGGFLPAHLSDALMALRNHLETYFRQEG